MIEKVMIFFLQPRIYRDDAQVVLHYLFPENLRLAFIKVGHKKSVLFSYSVKL